MEIRKTYIIITMNIELSGPQGNAFYLMGLVDNLGQQLGLTQEKVNIIVNEMKSSNYDNLLKTFIKNFGMIVQLYQNGKRLIPIIRKKIRSSPSPLSSA
jgi:hypothetical protein